MGHEVLKKIVLFGGGTVLYKITVVVSRCSHLHVMLFKDDGICFLRTKNWSDCCDEVFIPHDCNTCQSCIACCESNSLDESNIFVIEGKGKQAKSNKLR